MEISPFHPYSWDILYNPYMFLPYFHKPENYVHWRETPDSHVFSADLPGVRKEDIKVELEDLKYLIIRTEAGDNTVDPPRRFMKKFRLPGRIDLDGISAGKYVPDLSFWNQTFLLRIVKTCKIVILLWNGLLLIIIGGRILFNRFLVGGQREPPWPSTCLSQALYQLVLVHH
ncbi:18.8 kDa class V heat shock protein-like isoform X1 [Chenopodium quinoa]|uniref:18.8 kDa class V heat shock protein-like isoform X1 n=1 Tax=Chenopodium quinoa TaxID=63459 RepID=UPI000B79A47E|nr:18.8 kDa class V heat shock protein-like isoform X1 [Chenopodium quinoa]